ncbi:unnamed protein product [Pleuronectes platessa]|uniref:Uncharacterized protein n=1 Tax=Pleuronectes platessa TaxID=8262 RepID=A0A9N7TJT3_PLEPL|nr:unnamed protein product [Pleuronectes platessa]
MRRSPGSSLNGLGMFTSHSSLDPSATLCGCDQAERVGRAPMAPIGRRMRFSVPFHSRLISMRTFCGEVFEMWLLFGFKGNATRASRSFMDGFEAHTQIREYDEEIDTTLVSARGVGAGSRLAQGAEAVVHLNHSKVQQYSK